MKNFPSFFIYPDFNEKDIKRNYILFHKTRPYWLKLNSTALEIAKNLNLTESIDDTVNEIALKYNISVETARQDVLYVLDQLKNHHFINDQQAKSIKRTPTLKQIYFHLTSRCNLQCPHCYIAQDYNIKEDLPVEIVINMIDELIDSQGSDITLSGGEPLLYPEIKKIITYAASKLRIQILTNGTLIDRQWAEFFADKNVQIQISIDGSKKEIHDVIRGKGNFNRAIRAVKYLQEVGLGKRINFSTTIMKNNAYDLPEIIALAQRLDVPMVRFLPLRKIGRATDKWDSIVGMSLKDYEKLFNYVNELHKKSDCSLEISCGLSGLLFNIPDSLSEDDLWCPVGKRLVVLSNGDTYPCVMMMQDNFKLGSVFKDSLNQMIRSQKMAKNCQNLSERRNKIDKCASCKWRNFCQAGCMGQALDHKGTIWNTDDYCDYRRKAYKEAFDGFLKDS
ncbi:Radical SAM protein [Candidatus Magnetomoraceae bacterium gMMP-15]